MIFEIRPTGVRRDAALSLTRHALLVSTILGAGAMVGAPSASAADQTINLTTSQTNLGLQYTATGTDNITVTTTATGTISDNASPALKVQTVDGNIDLGGTSGLAGTITATSLSGIYATVSGTGSTNIKTATGATVTGSSAGIYSTTTTGPNTIDIGASVSSGSFGIYASSTSGQITITSATSAGTVTATTGGGSIGIYASSSSGGNVDIGGTSGFAGAISGETGIYASANNTGTVNVTTNATVTGTSANGISTSAGAGATTITFNGTVTGAGGSPAVSATSSGGSISIGGSGSTQIANGVTNARGISAQSLTGSISLSGTGNVTGVGSEAAYLSITSPTATADIEVTRSGTYTASNAAAIYATNSGTGNIKISNLGVVTATGSWSSGVQSAAAIYATASGGNIDIGGTTGLTNSVTGSTNISAIYANTSGTGTINVTTAAGGTLSGKFGLFVENGGSGATNINVNANVTGTAYVGIQSYGTNGTTTINVGQNATVTGATFAFVVKNGSGGPGTTTVNNYGTVIGRMSAQFGSNIFNNYGTLKIASGLANNGFDIYNLNGGTLTGAGDFNKTVAQSGSIILAGDRAGAIGGTTRFNGWLVLNSGSIIDVRVDAAANVNDNITAAGNVDVSGSILRVTATPKTQGYWSTNRTFTILTSTNGTVTGPFASVTTDYSFLNATTVLSDDQRSVLLTLRRNYVSFGDYAKNSNQKSVSDLFDRNQDQTSNPVISRITASTTSQTTNVLAQLSGTGLVATRTQSFSAKTLFTSAINTELGSFTSSVVDDKQPSGGSDSKADGRIWAHVLSGWGEMRENVIHNRAYERSNNFGLVAGADTALDANLRLGFALAGGQSTTKIPSLFTSAESTWGQSALYGVLTDGEDYLKGVVTYGYHDNKTDRSVTAYGTLDKAKGKFGGHLIALRLEAGHKFSFDPVSLTPFIALEPSWLFQKAFQETGPASVTLGFNKTTTGSLPTTLGLKADADFDLDDLRFKPSATIGWVHEFVDASYMSPYFTALPGQFFQVQGSKGDRDLARTELNFEATPKDTLATFYVNARADLGARTTSVRGLAGVNLRF